jgi:hypothetical protein
MSTQQMIHEAESLSSDELQHLIAKEQDSKSAMALFRQLQDSVKLTPEAARQWKMAVADARE